MFNETIRNDDFEGNTALQCCNSVVSIRNNDITLKREIRHFHVVVVQ